MLQPRPIARITRGSHLRVRVHVLRVVRKSSAWRAMPKLRRRTRRSSPSARYKAHQISSIHRTRPQTGGLRRGAIAALMSIAERPGSCSLCGESNQCAMASAASIESPCWCTRVLFTTELLASVPRAAQGKACICARCVAASASEQPAVSSNPSIERTSQRLLRTLWSTAHVERWAPVGEAGCTRCTVVEAGAGAFLLRS